MKYILLVVSLLLLGASPGHKWMILEVTAYDPGACCTNGDGMTATGRDASLDGIAVDPSVIPLGSHLDVPGITQGPNGNGSWLLADDKGGAIKGNKADIRMQTHQEALNWGRRILRVRVWEKP